jgi:HTH-type transcriptional regulator / antitoxin HipB
MPSHLKARAEAIPAAVREAIIEARRKRGWSQAEVGKRVGLPQTHISGIETGRVVPRYDTLLDLVRVLDHDLILVPRDLVPVVQSLIRDRRYRIAGGSAPADEEPLYALDDEEEESSS